MGEESSQPTIVSSFDTPSAYTSLRYAGLLIRFVANLIDDIIFFIIIIIPTVVLVYLMISAGIRDRGEGSIVILLISALFALGASWLYDAGFESSKYMATPGKMVCGLKVTDMEGRRITFGTATIRFFMKEGGPTILYLISKCLGFYSLVDVLAMYTNDQRQCIHDMVAGTVVIHG